MPRKSDVPYESKKLMSMSKHAHNEDVRHNSPRMGYAPNKPADRRSDKAKAFERKWLG